MSSQHRNLSELRHKLGRFPVEHAAATRARAWTVRHDQTQDRRAREAFLARLDLLREREANGE